MTRGHHIAPAERTQAYSDAVFAIVATIMVVPLSGETVSEVAESQDLLEGFGAIWFKLVIYAVCFGLTSSTWDLHAWVFQLLDGVNETIVLLNLGVLMVATFLPYSFLMFAEHPREPLAVSLFAGCVALQGFFMLAILWQAFSRPHLLKEEVVQQGKEAMKSERTRAIIKVLIRPVIYLIAIPVSFASVEVAWALLVFGVLKPIIFLAIDAIIRCAKGNTQAGTKMLRLSRIVSETSDTTRTNAYSDGVYAIVATLIILDICVNNVPESGILDIHGTLAEALVRDANVFLSFCGTFVTICLLWYLHHSMFYHILAQNALLLTLNKLALLFAGYLPIVFKLTGEFGHLVDDSESAVGAVQLNSATVFLASVFHPAIWITALCKKSELLRPSAHMMEENVFMFINLLIYPIVSLVIFCVCFVAPVSSRVINGVQIGLIAAFILIKLIRNLARRCMKAEEPKTSPEDGKELSDVQAKAEGPTEVKEDLEGYDNPALESTTL